MQFLLMYAYSYPTDSTFAIAGLQAAESIHHSSESHGVHSQRFLEDDLRQEVWSDCHAL